MPSFEFSKQHIKSYSNKGIINIYYQPGESNLKLEALIKDIISQIQYAHSPNYSTLDNCCLFNESLIGGTSAPNETTYLANMLLNTSDLISVVDISLTDNSDVNIRNAFKHAGWTGNKIVIRCYQQCNVEELRAKVEDNNQHSGEEVFILNPYTNISTRELRDISMNNTACQTLGFTKSSLLRRFELNIHYTLYDLAMFVVLYTLWYFGTKWK